MKYQEILFSWNDGNPDSTTRNKIAITERIPGFYLHYHWILFILSVTCYRVCFVVVYQLSAITGTNKSGGLAQSLAEAARGEESISASAYWQEVKGSDRLSFIRALMKRRQLLGASGIGGGADRAGGQTGRTNGRRSSSHLAGLEV